MSDIIEAAARAMCDRQAAKWNIISDASRKWYLELAAAVTPLIRSAALEEAAQVAEERERRESDNDGEHAYIEACRDIAYDLRALEEQP